jgi:hypothetical protein
MSRDSGSEHPSQRTVAELLAEYGGGSQRSARRRRRRAEDPSETAPQAIIDRVLSDSGQMRAVRPDTEAPHPGDHRPAPPANDAPPQPPHPPPAPPARPEPAEAERPSEAPNNSGGANFWARRFAAAGPTVQKPKLPAPTPPTPAGDPEETVQQPALPPRPQPQPRPEVAGPDAAQAGTGVSRAPEVEGVTEQFPRVDEPAAPIEQPGTALLAYPQDTEDADAPEPEYADPYDYETYDDSYDDESDGDDDYALPAGLEADDYAAEETSADEETEGSRGKEWFVLAAQVGVGLLGGALVWVGFRWLWVSIPVAALVAALIVTVCLVLIARKFLRTDDLQTILLAVLVGLTCTVSPAALLLVGH